MSPASAADRPEGADQISPLPGRFHAVIFDLDGLLLDTEPGWHQAEAELLRRHGAAYADADETATLGWSVDATLRRYLPRLGLGEEAVPRLTAELIDIVQGEYAGAIAVRPGAAELVERLRGHVPLGIASNTGRSLVVLALRSAAFGDAFAAVVSSEEVAHPKPAPDIYLEACRRLGVEPSAAVALEDSTSGILAARDAGLTVIAVPQWPVVDTSGADHVVSSLTQLLVG
ncbi:MAG: HAD family phosphatase [Chloroflexota bacterium]|nr:HAD family phosphatase [Chloroflexota bacterium]